MCMLYHNWTIYTEEFFVFYVDVYIPYILAQHTSTHLCKVKNIAALESCLAETKISFKSMVHPAEASWSLAWSNCSSSPKLRPCLLCLEGELREAMSNCELDLDKGVAAGTNVVMWN